MPSLRDDAWSDADVVLLRTLWAEGHTTPEIGRRMNRTKGSIIGKAGRLYLPSRPSPIKNGRPLLTPEERRERSLASSRRENERRRARIAPNRRGPVPPDTADAEPVARSTLPPLPSFALAPPRRLPPVTHRFTLAPALPRPERVLTPAPYGRVIPCCWPFGEPGKPEFRFCEDPSDMARPYCAVHMAVAYMRVRRTAEAVAA